MFSTQINNLHPAWYSPSSLLFILLSSMNPNFYSKILRFKLNYPHCRLIYFSIGSLLQLLIYWLIYWSIISLINLLTIITSIDWLIITLIDCIFDLVQRIGAARWPDTERELWLWIQPSWETFWNLCRSKRETKVIYFQIMFNLFFN